jgi:hypothetical protein
MNLPKQGSYSLFQASDNINHNLKNTLEDDITRRITFSPIPRKRISPFASNKRPTKKKQVRSNINSNNIKNKTSNQVAAFDTFKTSARTTDNLYTDKRGIVRNAIEWAIQRMPPFQNPTDTSRDIAETVESKISSPTNQHFPISLADDASNLNSDDGAGTSEKRASGDFPTYPQAPFIHGERAILVTAIEVDDHCKKRRILSKCALKWTPEQASFPLHTILRRSQQRPPNCTTRSSALLLGTSYRCLSTILRRSFATALSSYQEHPQVQTPAVPAALLPPLTRLRTPSSTVMSPTAPPQLKKLVQCPSVIRVLKMLLTPTSLTTFPIMASTLLTCKLLLLSTLRILRRVEIVCICTRLNSHEHSIIPNLRRNPNKINDGNIHQDILRQRHGIHYNKFPTHYRPARTYASSTDTDNIPACPHGHI